MDLARLSPEDLAERAQELLAQLAAVHAQLAARLRATSELRQVREDAARAAEMLTSEEWAAEAGVSPRTARRIAARMGWRAPVRQARGEWNAARERR